MNIKEYLTRVGISTEPTYFISFNIDDIKYIDDHTVIGNDHGTYICINQNEEIVSIDEKYEYPERFVNSNLESLISFILVYLRFEEKLNDEAVSVVIETIRKEFMKIDSRAIENKDNWWEIILEQIEYGIM